jgi:hypothetical protein
MSAEAQLPNLDFPRMDSSPLASFPNAAVLSPHMPLLIIHGPSSLGSTLFVGHKNFE